MSDSIQIDTPEFVDLSLEPAGLGSRFLAALIDGLIQVGVMILLMTVLFIGIAITEGRAPDLLEGIVLAILVLLVGFLFLGYKVLLEAFWNGQTVGKRVVGIRVVRSNGLPVTFLQVLIRNLLRMVDQMPMYYLIGCICILASKQGQRLGDMAAGTVVVRERKSATPVVPTALTHQPEVDLNRLREYVLRLSEEDLEPARRFLERRWQLQPEARYRVSWQIAQGLIARMGWPEPMPTNPEFFIEEVLFVRAR